EGTGLGKPLSDTHRLGPRGGWADSAGGEREFQGMDRGHDAICSPPGISSAKYPARVYPEARQARETPSGRALRSRPGAPEKRCSGALGYLRAGFFALLVWWTAWAGCPSSAGNPA